MKPLMEDLPRQSVDKNIGSGHAAASILEDPADRFVCRTELVNPLACKMPLGTWVTAQSPSLRLAAGHYRSPLAFIFSAKMSNKSNLSTQCY